MLWSCMLYNVERVQRVSGPYWRWRSYFSFDAEKVTSEWKAKTVWMDLQMERVCVRVSVRDCLLAKPCLRACVRKYAGPVACLLPRPT